MLITVGIPVYNAERYIDLAIQSVLDQTYTDFELIVTDDGSTDGTREIVRSFKDSRIVFVCDGMHKGLAVRLNEQIAQARGKYYARMDADDVMLPMRLERQLDFFKHHPETDVVGSSSIVIDENDIRIGWRGTDNAFKTDKIKCGFVEVSSFMHPTVTGCTQWFRRYYYNPTCEGCEDLELWTRSVSDSKFYEIIEPLMLYRDPQMINLDVYLYRRRQERYALKLNRERFSFFHYLFIHNRSVFKSVAVWTLSKMGQENLVLSARNHHRAPIENSILHVITSLRVGGAEKLMVELLPRLKDRVGSPPPRHREALGANTERTESCHSGENSFVSHLSSFDSQLDVELLVFEAI